MHNELARAACIAISTLACHPQSCVELASLGACDTIMALIRDTESPFEDAMVALRSLSREVVNHDRLCASGAFKVIARDLLYPSENILGMIIMNDANKTQLVHAGICKRIVELLKESSEDGDLMGIRGDLLSMVALLAGGGHTNRLLECHADAVIRPFLHHLKYHQAALCALTSLVPAMADSCTQHQIMKEMKVYQLSSPWVATALDSLSRQIEMCRGNGDGGRERKRRRMVQVLEQMDDDEEDDTTGDEFSEGVMEIVFEEEAPWALEELPSLGGYNHGVTN